MKKPKLPYCWLLLLVSIACEDRAATVPVAPALTGGAPQPDKRVTLSSPRRDYLLGEPVLLELTFRHNSRKTLKVNEIFVEPDFYATPVWIAPAGERFEQLSFNTIMCFGLGRVFLLEQGDMLKYNYRVVVGRVPEVRLAFPKPGDYRIYVEYPLWIYGAQKTVMLASNVVEVRVRQPGDEDAKVFEQLQDKSFLTLLQCETFDKRHPDLVLKMADLVRDNAASGYAPTVRRALSKIYFRHRLGLPQQDQLRLAQILGITHVDSIVDDRLEVRRKVLLDKEPLVGSLLAAFTNERVFLAASPDLNGKIVTVVTGSDTIRQAMRSLSDDLEASWERRGDGYFLAPFDAAKGVGSKKKDKNGK